MIWLIQDFALLAVILRALTLILQSVVLGGVVFVAFVLTRSLPAFDIVFARCRSLIGRFALGLAAVQFLYVAIDTAILCGTTHRPPSAMFGADYFIAGTLCFIASLAVALIALSPRVIDSPRNARLALAAAVSVLVIANVWTSHAVSRLDNRLLLAIITLAHQAAAAAWVGALVFLLVALRWLATEPGTAASQRLLNRYSILAIVSAATLITSGAALSVLYIGSAPALYGTAYGFMVLCKIFLLFFLLVPGAVSWSFSHRPAFASRSLHLIRRLSEFEIGIGITIILAAASLTSQPPAVDLVEDRLSGHEIAQRMKVIKPGFTTPGVAELAPPTPLEIAVNDYDNVERATAHQQRDPDIAWSEYSHHWAGIILLCIGLGAFIAHFPRGRWAKHWPLGFIALAIFSFLRGDPENWPLGPISFWKSFYDPEVLTHRLYDLIFIVYAGFEWGVQTGRLKRRGFAYVFPVMLALGGAGLLLHNHALGNIKNELLIEMSHNAMGILAVLAGLGGLLELRLPEGRARALAGYAWPLCLTLVGFVLLNYREA